jgi:membrane fusion protein, multidrug efflux system
MSESNTNERGPETLRAGDSLSPSPSRRRIGTRVRLFLIFAVVVAALAVGGWMWWQQTSTFVGTDNAYVDSTIANVLAQTDGIIARVLVRDTQPVKKGDVLVELDAADARLVLARAEADYGRALRRVRQYFEKNKAAAAEVNYANAVLAQARIDLNRRRRLVASKSISEEDLTNAQAAYDTAVAALAVAQGRYEAQITLTAASDVDNHPEVLAARTAVDSARLALQRTVIRSPIDGTVIQKRAALGQRVQAGAPMMNVVSLSDVFVNANYKENQLRRVRVGQPATLTADIYGSNVVYRGRVAGLGAGTGAAFAIIPAQNATGSWIKVVQRLPVRIDIEQAALAKHPLRVGLSMHVKIDIRNQ